MVLKWSVLKMQPRNYKNILNCIFCNENTGECFFNVNWNCHIYCIHHICFNPIKQLQTKILFDNTIEGLQTDLLTYIEG